MTVIILTVLASVAMILTILAAYQKWRLTHYLFKPLTILFIILIALEPNHPTSSFYRYAIIAGLLFSLAGDIFLMLPQDRFFMHGLIGFFIAHFFYVAAFTYESGLDLPGWSMGPFLVYGILMMSVLWPHLGKLRAPVLAYVLAILLMGWTATGRGIWTEQPGSILAMLGALFFIASDSLLALDKFKGRFRSAQLLIFSTYAIAQWLIALST
jgi:uncharacterized membrane protein YhhN